MSGIAGIIRLDGGPIEPGLLEGMTASLAHRGPDGIGHWHGEGAALGQCMMRTTPESGEEAQPLVSADGTLVLVMDGRVDNWEDLRRAVTEAGGRPRTRADSELVLAAFQLWGEDCLDRIEGDYALVIWDLRRRRAVAVRDRFGARPLFYRLDGQRFAFASEVRPLLELSPETPKLNLSMVAQAIRFDFRTRAETLWQGVHCLIAANFLAVDAGGHNRRRYWTPVGMPAIRYRRIEEYAEHLRELMFEQVRRMSRADAPISCEVSGGLDSSGIFAVADALAQRGELNAPGLTGYTLRFADGSSSDEIEFARSVARHLGRSVREVAARHWRLDQYAEHAREWRDFPGYPNSLLGLGISEDMVANGSRVVLQGLGGDEWLSGSRYYYAEFLRELRLGALARALATDRRAFGTRKALFWLGRFGLAACLPRFLQAAARSLWRSGRDSQKKHSALLSENLEHIMHSAAESDPDAGRDATIHADAVRNTRLFGANKAFINNCNERMKAIAGVENRKPFETRGIVEFCYRTPEASRQIGGNNRISYRLAMQGLLPENVRSRRTKAEFSETFIRLLEQLLVYSDIDEVESRAGSWLADGEFGRMLATALQSDGARLPLWTVWGIFGCALLTGRVHHRHN